MSKIEIRYQRLSDAKRFFEIINNPNFIYLDIRVKSIEDERLFLSKNKERRKSNFAYNYTITLNKKVVGSIGIKINQHRPYIGEIGYFIDEAYWGQGITTKAVKLVEEIGFKKLNLKRIEVIMDPKNKASEKVAIKNNYKKEGLMKKFIIKENSYQDALLYAKVL
ncbi:MAG: GNAT family N-acetyltransferase [Patescibacteria group bacterium]|nr:GNAT family N-acetyltransferase [Patescibacteria group bacterium]